MKNPNILTPAEIAKLIPFIKLIQNWCNKVHERALILIRKGEEIPGYKLVEGRSNRVWSNPDDAESYLEEVKELPQRHMFKKKLITPAQAEKIVGKKDLGLQALIKKPPGNAVLAEANDKRPTLDRSAASDFSALD